MRRCYEAFGGNFAPPEKYEKCRDSAPAPKELGLYYLQSRYYDPEMGRFLNADAYISTGQGELGNNMFVYCNNNPVVYIDIGGNYPLPVPSIADFYNMHRQVQYDIIEQYGFAMEVRIISALGSGRLDLFDPLTNQYYEVKSMGQAGLATTAIQMEKYDVSLIVDWRFVGYIFNGSPERGSMEISGSCTYSYWNIYYRSDGNGLITYRYFLNEAKYREYLSTLVAAACVVGVGYACVVSSGARNGINVTFVDDGY